MLRTVSRIQRLAGMAIFTAIVVVLQSLASVVHFSFSITLALVPIVVGAATYGAAAGAFLGGVFGVVVLIACIYGADPGGHALWLANPAMTAALCLVKGALAGAAAGIVYTAISRRNVYIGVMCAALVCPVVNTGIFIAALLFIFKDTLTKWAGDTDILYHAFIVVAGLNFLFELGVNIVLSPAVVRIIRASRY